MCALCSAIWKAWNMKRYALTEVVSVRGVLMQGFSECVSWGNPIQRS